jgi:hypothetical protein
MDALETWCASRFDTGPETIGTFLQRSGIYIFLISFACVYYFLNARSCLAIMIWDGTWPPET